MTKPRKVLTAAQMGAVDRATVEAGIPGIVLMENAAHRCVEFLAARFGPLNAQRVLVVCGKGNNGGDGLAIARQIYVRFQPRELRVVLMADAAELKGDAELNYKMLLAAGMQMYWDFGPEMRTATLVVDAVLGTGLKGPATRRGAECDPPDQHRVSPGEDFCCGYPVRSVGRFGRCGGRICAGRRHRHVYGSQGLPCFAARFASDGRTCHRADRVSAR